MPNTGIELATFRSLAQRSNQMSYAAALTLLSSLNSISILHYKTFKARKRQF